MYYRQWAFKKSFQKLIINQVNVHRQCIHDFFIVSFDLSGRQWPVTLGTTQIPCPLLPKAMLFQEAFQYVAWYKVVVRRQACHSRWTTLWIAGMNSSWTVKTNRDSKYVLNQGGFLQIRNVTRNDDGTFYRCVVRGKLPFGIKSTLILLAVVPEEGKIMKELAD